MVLRKTPLNLLCFLIIGLASCNKANTVTPNKGKDLVITPVEQQEVSADNAFTLKLFKNLDSANTTGNNLFASPLSASMALSMASNGAAGQTLTAMWNTLSFNGFPQDSVNNYYHALITNLPLLDPNTTVNVANSIWYTQALTVLSPFLKTNSSSYNAKVQTLDFSDPASVNTINNWVSAQTNGAIPSIVKQISAQDKMYLINAIYFKSIWNEKFDATKTSPQPFYLADNSTVQPSFMDGNVDFNRYNDNNVTVIELPYANRKFSMIIAMPTNGGNVHQLLASIDSNKWKTWMAGLVPQKAEVKLPKFKFNYNINLNDPLTDLGMGIALGNNADFSLITTTLPLQITKVLQNAYVDVNESGTTAAAVTVVVVGTSVAAPSPNVTIDHPFIFAIRQVSSGLIMFTGTVNNPLLAGQ
jgi:serpin B